mmetsp:Transcript_17280/g.41624  ORF Transcript_17280/g.41624 Transcript_17280/m.41624 type:complete len:286 (-) Transcript_17280:169-1026(-)
MPPTHRSPTHSLPTLSRLALGRIIPQRLEDRLLQVTTPCVPHVVEFRSAACAKARHHRDFLVVRRRSVEASLLKVFVVGDHDHFPAAVLVHAVVRKRADDLVVVGVAGVVAPRDFVPHPQLELRPRRDVPRLLRVGVLCLVLHDDEAGGLLFGAAVSGVRTVDLRSLTPVDELLDEKVDRMLGARVQLLVLFPFRGSVRCTRLLVLEVPELSAHHVVDEDPHTPPLLFPEPLEGVFPGTRTRPHFGEHVGVEDEVQQPIVRRSSFDGARAHRSRVDRRRRDEPRA